jgi:L,D-transpeptidase ErfK/SrfK
MRSFVPMAVALILAACLEPARAAYDEDTFVAKPLPVYSISTPARGERPASTVIGDVQPYRIRKGDTLLDVARYHDLGYNEIVEANPGIDPWLPPVGAIILLPTEWVLPCCTYEGLVVNIPEMRLFLYRRAAGGTTTVHTFPVGLGRDDWRTPSGKFKIRGKTLNPQWNIPESIRKEHIAERGDARTFIAGGDPENPLGNHRIELTLPMYAIHGTNIPWGVGMQVSHGCVRLYPEDIERLFPLVAVGIPGEFAYQPVKAGTRAGAVYIEAHRDIYGYTPAPYREATRALQRAGLTGRADERLLLSALEASEGMPTRVSVGAAPAGGPAAMGPLASHGVQEGSRAGISPTDDDQAGDD